MLLNELTIESVASVAHGKALGILVPGFIKVPDAWEIADEVSKSPFFAFDGPGFRSFGPGCFELPGAADAYFSSAVAVSQVLRGPFQAMQEILGSLAVPRYEGRPMRPLTARRYDSTFEAPPHQDRDQDRYPWAQYQLGISLSLLSPWSGGGGAIRLWDHSYGPEEYAGLTLPGRFELDESRIPAADLTVNPEDGDLLILDARRIHAIDRIKEGTRFSISGFLSPNDTGWIVWS